MRFTLLSATLAALVASPHLTTSAVAQVGIEEAIKALSLREVGPAVAGGRIT